MQTPEAQPQETRLIVGLQRSPFATPGFILVTMMLAAVSLMSAFEIYSLISVQSTGEMLIQPIAMLLVSTGAAIFSVARRLYVRTKPLPPVVFFDDRFTLPASSEATRSRTVAYADVLSVGLRGRPQRLELLLETRRELFLLELSAFRDPQGAQRLTDELHRRILVLPQGPSMFEQAERRRALTARAMTVRPIATQAICGTLLVVYANQLLSGAALEPLGLIRWGALVPALVREGEYFRVLAASFLHTSDLHLAICLLTFYFVGSMLERIVGWLRFLLIFLSSGLAAMAVAALVPRGEPFFGSSPALLGLFGCLAVLHVRLRGELPAGFRQPRRWWVGLGAIFVLLLLLTGFEGAAAHAAGLLTGVLLSLGLFAPGRPVPVGTPARSLLWAAAAGVLALYGLGLGQAVLYAGRFDTAAAARVTTVLLRTPETSANLLNSAAWSLATDPNATSEGLEAALAAATRAVDSARPPLVEPSYRDTLATVHFRRGELEEAVREQRRALGAAHELLVPKLATQLERFLAARLTRDGPLAAADAPVLLTLRFPEPAEPGAQPAAVHLELAAPPERGVTLYALVARSDRRLGLLQLCLGPSTEAKHEIPFEPTIQESLAAKSVRLVPVVIEPAPAGTAPGFTSARLFPHESKVDELP